MADKKKKITEGPERRYLDNPVEIVTREAGEEGSRTIRGYWIKFETLSRSLGWFREKIARGSLDDIDFENSDIVALFNHNFDKIIGRTIADPKLIIGVDEEGAWFECDAPNTTAGNDCLENVKLGLVQHCSFSWPWGTVEDKWEEDDELGEIRTITKFTRIIDVSPVVNPAYLSTEVDARNIEGARTSYDTWKKDSSASTYRRDAAKRSMEIDSL